MNCIHPSEQVFILKDKIIGIDFGKNGDYAVQTSLRQDKDGKFTVLESKILNK